MQASQQPALGQEHEQHSSGSAADEDSWQYEGSESKVGSSSGSPAVAAAPTVQEGKQLLSESECITLDYMRNDSPAECLTVHTQDGHPITSRNNMMLDPGSMVCIMTLPMATAGGVTWKPTNHIALVTAAGTTEKVLG